MVQMYALRTIGPTIRCHAELRPEHPAIVSTQFAPLSYRELQHTIDEISRALRQAGFDRNARIIVALPNGPEAALAIVAIACSAVAVPLDPKLTFPEVETRLAFLRPNAILLLRGSVSVARRVAENRGLTIIEGIVKEGGKLGLQFVVPQLGPAALPDDPDPEAPAFILQTSGTTADPKLIPFSHRNMLAAADRLQAWFKLTPQDRCLCAGPVHYSHGLKVTVFTPLLTGGSVAFPRDASLLDISEWLGVLKPTWYSAGPTLHLAMLEKAKSRPDKRTMHSLRFIVSGGASLSKDVQEGLQATLDVHLLEHYGSSEAAQISANLPPPGPSKPGTCGIPWPDTVIIVGEDGGRLPPGQHGEILVGGPTLMSGYLDAPELNEAAFTDGWFRTGDIGSLDEDGFLTLHGRQKEFINRGGEKIAPFEIDRALMSHPEVVEAAAYAVPHPRLGEDVAAAVVLSAGSTVTSTELREFLGIQLAAFKIPQRIVVHDHLPKGASGKVQRQRLSEYAKEKSRQTAVSRALHRGLLQLSKRFLRRRLSTDDDSSR
jgi:acyl-CoA synthetase (AMP-forming)/AMP-acid ligase II